jgi:hypothetical protein
MIYKIAAVALVFSGEAFEIAAEIFSSKYASKENHLAVFLEMLALMVIGGALLVGGYMLGYLHFKNIWILVAVSLATLAIGEPLLAYVLFQEPPTTGSFVGLVLGVLALLATFLIP